MLYVPTQFPYWSNLNLSYVYQLHIIDQNDSFRYFRLLMSTWSDSICENTFETSHVRFIHENVTVTTVDYYTAWSNSMKRYLPNHGQTCGHRFADVIWRIPNPTSRVDLNPLRKKATSSKRDDRFSIPFFEMVPKTWQGSFFVPALTW